MNIYILTEITKRELDSNLLLACLAANNNFNVLISNHATIKLLNDKNLLKEGLFHTKSLVHGDKKKELHEALKKNNIKISSIDEEAGLVLKDLTSFSKARFTEDDFKVADKIFCWGKHDHETLDNLFKNSKSKLILSGSHRFDMMREEFKEYWNYSKDKIKKITISGNFNLVNGYVHKSKIISELDKQGYFNRSEKYKQELMNIIEDTEKKFHKFIEMLNTVIQHFPNEYFHLRPHPLEKIETWERHFSKFKNVNISKEGNINEQMVNSKLLIHNSCTSAFHSFFYNIPTISYEPVKCISDYGQPANELSESVDNVEDLCSLIEKIVSNNYKISNQDVKNNLFKNKVFVSQTSYSSEIIVNEWIKLTNKMNKSDLNLKKIKFELLKDKIKNHLTKIAIKILKPFKKLYFDKKFEDISEIAIINKIKKIQAICNINTKLSVTKVSNKCFLIRKI